MTQKNFYIEANYADAQGNSTWQDTGVEIPAGSSVSFTATGNASGLYNANAGCNEVGPGGTDPILSNSLVPKLNTCAAIGQIGNGTPFMIGDAQVETSEGGKLKLACNDSLATDNKGGFLVNYKF